VPEELMKKKVTEAKQEKGNWLTGLSKAEIEKAMQQKYGMVQPKPQTGVQPVVLRSLQAKATQAKD
jgi:hypothetical protein